ncbi:2,3,4,5-tetrahydropyridine-2,6-dicarboxylate N-succinyltransferase [Cumulibacter manganitolerans]|uniref:2,3,4,5-tetrahydropyridine-2,6-dicarboxylate N-succinyltransferase n=1 Tax=Cumulibacter manganitolerans TaxID=1884992 RepID=UPI001297A854|nr:2,3,4,5-tetrahydropyridine-2,6-dicarboxylate N-succinyltransferase [Cumulibacter manganitolerans]
MPLLPSAAAAYGLATIADDGSVLDVWFPAPALAEAGDGGTSRPEPSDVPAEHADLVGLAGEDAERQVRQVVVQTRIASLADAPADAYDAYLRLHLLSARVIKPNEASMEGIFGKLTNVVWTNHGPCAVDGFAAVRARLRSRGAVTVYGVDKFPRMVDYLIPSGVRIADADRVRLGAHLAEGTTVMHEGFVNFNAGTLGNAMVEGRISAGVVVGNDSDVGGGASIMGTLSGGGKETITIGERCLIGANGGVGISLGDDCVVEAGCYVTAGTKVTLPDGSTKKGAELSGESGILYLRNSVTGAIEARPHKGEGVVLNEALHAN